MRIRTLLTALAAALLAALAPAMTGPVSAKPATDPPDLSRFNPPGLLPLDGQHLFNDTFTRVNTVKALPLSVQSELLGTKEKAEREIGGTAKPAQIVNILILLDGMADPGQPFETSDAVGPNPLPHRRLVFAGVSAGYCFVYNEYGGIVEGTEVSLYRLPQLGAAGHAALVWQASLQDFQIFQAWKQLRWAIIQGRYDTRCIPPRPSSPALAKFEC